MSPLLVKKEPPPRASSTQLLALPSAAERLSWDLLRKDHGFFISSRWESTQTEHELSLWVLHMPLTCHTISIHQGKMVAWLE